MVSQSFDSYINQLNYLSLQIIYYKTRFIILNIKNFQHKIFTIALVFKVRVNVRKAFLIGHLARIN